jgi:hypothetical protein
MAQDPRLDSLMQYAMTAVGAGPTDDSAVLRQRIENLERLVSVILRTPNVQLVSGTPTLAARDGTLALDTSALRLWVRRNSGMARPKQNLSDAGALASQTQQTMQAVYNCADALAKLETAFPTSTPPATP